MPGKHFWGFGIIEDIFQIVFSAAELNLGEQIFKKQGNNSMKLRIKCLKVQIYFQITFTMGALELSEQIYKIADNKSENPIKKGNVFPNYIYDGRAQSRRANMGFCHTSGHKQPHDSRSHQSSY